MSYSLQHKHMLRCATALIVSSAAAFQLPSASSWADDGVHGKELWVSDGTESGTVELSGTVPGGLSYPTQMVNANGDLYFVAYQDATGAELWMLPLDLFKDGFESGDTSAWDVSVP